MMTAMKGFALLLSLLLAFGSPLPARAGSLSYAAAPDSNVWFYTGEREEDKLFLIPETYYVRVLSEGEEYTAVEYQLNDPPYRKLVGYCKTDALLFVDFVPVRPYLDLELTVTYSVPSAGTGILGNAFETVEKTFVYYGMRYERGQLFLYVSDGADFGFLPAEEIPSFEKNNDFLSVPAGPSGGTEEPPSDTGGTSALQIVLICVILVAAAGLALLVLLKGRRSWADDEES